MYRDYLLSCSRNPRPGSKEVPSHSSIQQMANPAVFQIRPRREEKAKSKAQDREQNGPNPERNEASYSSIFLPTPPKPPCPAEGELGRVLPDPFSPSILSCRNDANVPEQGN
jgi:hypothetical protein